MSSNSRNNKSGGWILPLFFICLFTGNIPFFVFILIISSIIKGNTNNKRSRNEIRNQNPRVLHSHNVRVNSNLHQTGPQYNADNLFGVFNTDSSSMPNRNQTYNNVNASQTNAVPLHGQQATPHTSIPGYGLPKQAAKRTKLLTKFNNTYGLNLSSDQIQRIVDASYMSVEWTKELVSMSAEYETVSSWFAGEHAWLRAYLMAFQVQNISSDFTMQEQIVFDSFDRVFADICNDPSQPMERAIARINEKYPIMFDEVTFTIAYRFLESKGKKYPVSFTQIFSMDNGIDDLLSKYSKGDTSPSGTIPRRF